MNIDRSEISKIVGDKFIFHYDVTDWGGNIMIMSKDGNAFARLYWYNEDEYVVYLNWLNVNEQSRKHGIGTELQIIRENIGRYFGAKESLLQVKDGSWMKEWYQRRGYAECKDSEKEENLIWMCKQLN